MAGFVILTLLAEKANQNVGYREVYDLIHGRDFAAGRGWEGYRAHVRIFIKRIRKKLLGIDSDLDHIKNCASIGYCWTT